MINNIPEIIAGLLSEKKYISSKFFYDDIGSQLFKSITQLPEYYLTKAEYEIIEKETDNIIKQLNSKKVNIIELGSGDGIKTKLMINQLLDSEIEVTYTPIDISQSALDKLKYNFSDLLSNMNYNPICEDYFIALNKLKENIETTNIILFMGSNIGNYSKLEAEEFLFKINTNISHGSYLLVGYDLIKSPEIIYSAYNDSLGITKAFNLNLLTRINKEYEANFDITKFTHFPTYNPETGEMKSYIISLQNQTINVKSLRLEIKLAYAEPIYTEVSRKFSLDSITELSEKSNFILIDNYFDCKKYFCVSLMRK